MTSRAPHPGPGPRWLEGDGLQGAASRLVGVTDAGLTGLSQVEASRRLAAAPPPEAQTTTRSYASIVRSNTLTLFNLILGAFWVVILAAGRPADGLFGLVLVANTGIGILQDVRAKWALDRLALLVAPHARVVRDATETTVPANEVVDGDLVALRPGDQVVAGGSGVGRCALIVAASLGRGKPGTLTGGTLALHGVFPAGGATAQDAERQVGEFAASITSRNDTIDAIAAALPATARPVTSEVPFSSRWKWSACRLEGELTTLVLGAPDVLLGGGATALVAEHEAAGRRTLVLGAGPAELSPPGDGTAAPEIEPLAVIALEEHVRPEARDTIEFLREQGVVVKVLSGDSPATVAAVAERAGIVVEGPPIDGAGLAEGADMAEAATGSTVFARLSPQQKRALIESLGSSGRYVAMIGDGVNDVPAMKGSRLAIALGSGAQMAKSVADSVLVTDSFAAVPAAIGEGRQIILNIQRVARLFVTKTVFAAAVILTFGLATAGFPLLPRHLTLAATVTVGIPGFVIALIPTSERPEPGSFLRRVARFALPAGAVTAAAVLAAYLPERAVRARSL